MPFHKQLGYIVLPFVAFSVVNPPASWATVVWLMQVVESVLGMHVQLVGDPGGVDPGAVLVTVCYLLVAVAVSVVSLRRRLYWATLGVLGTAVCFARIVFILVSSMIWF